jgi:hypothetical protein
VKVPVGQGSNGSGRGGTLKRGILAKAFGPESVTDGGLGHAGACVHHSEKLGLIEQKGGESIG